MRRLRLFVFAAALGFLSSCAAPKNLPNDEFLMGVMLPVSGVNGEAASEIIRGMMVARDEINSNGGVGGKKIRLLISDSSAEDFSMLGAVEKMKGLGVKFFHIGFTQELAFPLKTLSKDEEIFINCVCEYPPATISGKNSVRIFLNGAQVGEEISKFINRPTGEEVKFVGMNVDDLFGKSCGDYLAFNVKLERTKYFSDVFTCGEENFDIFADQILRISPLYVFYTGYGGELSSFSEALRKKGYTGTIVANTPPSKKARSFSKGSLYAVKTLFEAGKLNGVETSKFKELYRKRNESEGSWLSAYGYDGICLVAKAAEASNFDPLSARKYFEGKTFDGAVGKLTFDSSGDSVSEIGIFKE